MSWETQGLNSIWSSLHQVQVYNNVLYDFATPGASSVDSSFSYTWSDLKTATCEANWAINYNLYRSQDSYGLADWYRQSPEQGGLCGKTIKLETESGLILSARHMPFPLRPLAVVRAAG